MFREVARKKQALSKERCIEILKQEKRGVLSVIGDEGYPYGMPINHYYDEKEGKLYFHGGKAGHKIDALKKNDKVSYCVYGDGVKEGDNWYLSFESVIVFGRMRFIEDESVIAEKSRALSYKFTDDEKYIEDEIAKSLKGTLLLELEIEHMSGKHINEF